MTLPVNSAVLRIPVEPPIEVRILMLLIKQKVITAGCIGFQNFCSLVLCVSVCFLFSIHILHDCSASSIVVDGDL